MDKRAVSEKARSLGLKSADGGDGMAAIVEVYRPNIPLTYDVRYKGPVRSAAK